jgi:hypothetical protein
MEKDEEVSAVDYSGVVGHHAGSGMQQDAGCKCGQWRQ